MPVPSRRLSASSHGDVEGPERGEEEEKRRRQRQERQRQQRQRSLWKHSSSAAAGDGESFGESFASAPALPALPLVRMKRREAEAAASDGGGGGGGGGGGDGSAFGDWDYFDRLRERYVPPASSSDPPSDVYRVRIPSSDVYYDLRHIANINPILIGHGGTPSQVFVDSAMAGIMALHHFNQGISDVVPQVKDLTERCRTKFTMDFIDSRFSTIVASRAFLDDVMKRGKSGRGHEGQLPVPTALIGAVRSAVSSPLAILSGVYSVPQFSFASTSTVFDNKDQYPLFGRVVPSAVGDAKAAVDYLSNVLEVTHFGILHVRDPYGSTYAQALRDAAAWVRPVPLRVRSVSFPPDRSSPAKRSAAISEAVRQLKESGLRYFVGIFFYYDYDEIMAEAMRRGIAGGGYFWLFSEGLESTSSFAYDAEAQADLVEASHGSAVLTTASPLTLEGRTGYEAFLRHWGELRQPGSEAHAYFDSKMPKEFGAEMLATFQFSEMPFTTTPLLSYDAVIAAAFAACGAATAVEAGVDGGTWATYPANLTGEDVYASFLNVTFDGVYGHVAIDPATGSRVGATVPYSVSNLLTSPPDRNGTVSLRLEVTDVFDQGEGGTSLMSWRNLRPFVFSDETTWPPPPLPPLKHDANMIGAGAHAAGYAMCAIVALTSLLFSIWTWRHRSCRVIKSAQPVFLYILAAGTLLMGCAIVPLGVEEPTPQRGLDAACMAGPWLISLGFSLTFAALFAKTLRVNKLLKNRDMRRMKVEAKQVMKPAAALVAMNAVIMAIWTGVAPLRYERITVEGSVDSYGRPTASYGMCVLPDDPSHPGEGTTWWVGTLMVVLISVCNAAALAVALYQVYQARNIETEFSESKYVALSVVSIVQAWLIGVPLFFIGRDSPQGLYVILSSILFIQCQSILMLIFVPKVYFLREWRKKQEWRERERQRKMQTPTWMVNSIGNTASSGRSGVRARASARDMMAKEKSMRGGLGGSSTGSAAAASPSVGGGGSGHGPSPPCGHGDTFAANAALPAVEDGGERNDGPGGGSGDDSRNPKFRRLLMGSEGTSTDSQAQVGELRVAFKTKRVVKSRHNLNYRAAEDY